jgi:hypothetical protein
MFGVNEYYESLLLEAKSPEEIKKILTYKFVSGKGVPESVLDEVLSIDPTKKKTYTSWVLNLWENEKDTILNYLKNGTLVKIFKYFAERNNSGLNLTAMESLKQAYNMLPDVDPVLRKHGDGGPEDEYNIVYNSPEWKIAVPNTYEASRKLGQGCRWCTAGAFGKGEYYFDSYSNCGPLWINFDMRKPEISPVNEKEYPYTRYQFLFEYKDWYGEFMDSDDERISFDEINMPNEVVEFYRSKNEVYGQIIEGEYQSEEDLWANYNRERIEGAIKLKNEYYGHELLLMEPKNTREPVLGTFDYYQLYDGEDVEDSFIPFSQFDRDCVVNSMENMPCVLLKDKEGKLWLAFLEEDSYWSAIDVSVDNNYFISDDGFVCLWSTMQPNGKSRLYYFDYDSNNDYFDNKLFNNTIKELIYKPLEKDGIETEGKTLEIIFEDGFRSLLLFTPEYGMEVIVGKDKPLNGDKFTVETNEKGYSYIKGLYGIHFIDLNCEGPETKSYDFEREIKENLYIVYSPMIGDFNIYNKSEDRLVLDKWCENILEIEGCENLLLLFVEEYYAKKRIIYNINTQKKEKFDFIRNIPKKGLIVGDIKANSEHGQASYLLDKEGNSLLSFRRIPAVLDDEKLIVQRQENGLYNFYDLKNNSFLLEHDVPNIISIYNESVCSRDFDDYSKSYFIVGGLYDGVISYYFYNYIKNKLICKISDKPIDISDYFYGNNSIFKIHYKGNNGENDGYNVVINDELLFQDYVDEIWQSNHCKEWLPFVDKEKLYFINIFEKEIRPKGGFNTNFLSSYRYVCCTSDFKGVIMQIKIYKEFNSDEYNQQMVGKLTYYPETNTIEVNPPELREWVLKNILCDIGQISENFKRMFERINNVKF